MSFHSYIVKQKNDLSECALGVSRSVDLAMNGHSVTSAVNILSSLSYILYPCSSNRNRSLSILLEDSHLCLWRFKSTVVQQ